MESTRDTISLIKKGNQHAFQALVYRYSDELLVFSIGFVRVREVAEEIVSDAFVSLWKERERIFEIRDIKSYLYIIVRNASISHLRKMSGRKEITLENLEEFHTLPLTGPETDDITEEMLAWINAAIDQLPPKCKAVFTLAKVQGLKYKEISEILGISVKTINNHIANALVHISQSLNQNKKITGTDFGKIALFLFY
ncbi:RNA polymerase sigma factor [Gaoshiqia sp. Z1-71]|uniref:RNA polymerase sigma factor n=1 Tax=Gaoshiqia hydrogeniformans TaxID=3290090 RepID=UPI003BF8F3A4